MRKIQRTFRLKRDYFGDHTRMFTYGNLSVTEGRTMLVGCNGTGKSTLLREIHQQLRTSKSPVRMYDGAGSGSGQRVAEMFMAANNAEGVAVALSSSEGEKCRLTFGQFLGGLQPFVRSCAGAECWLLFDGLDSGVSLDNVCEYRWVFEQIEKDAAEYDVTLFIVCTANTFAFVQGECSVDARTGNQYYFDDYEQYKEFVLASRKRLDERNGIRPRKEEKSAC